MDFFKNLFGISPTTTTQPFPMKLKTFGPQTSHGGRYVIAGALDPHSPASSSQSSPSKSSLTLEFYLWESGQEVCYIYTAKNSKEEAGLNRLYNRIVQGQWTLNTDHSPPTTIVLKPLASELQKGQKESEGPKEVQLNLNVSTGANRFQDMTHAYLDRLNKFLVSMQKEGKVNDNFTEAMHRKLWTVLVESRHLISHLQADPHLDSSKRSTRFKLLNEWITRLLLLVDGLNVPWDEASGDPDPFIRASRKAIVSFALALGAELLALSNSAASSSANGTTKEAPGGSNDAPGSSNANESKKITEMDQLQDAAHPKHRIAIISDKK